MKSKTFVLTLVVALYSSCLLAEEPKGFDRLVVQKSGGFIGIQVTYEITPDGKFKISDLKGSKKGQLEGDSLTAFNNAVNAVDWPELPAKKLAQGTDQYLYTVAIITDNKFYSRTFHELAHADNKALKAFLAVLAKLK